MAGLDKANEPEEKIDIEEEECIDQQKRMVIAPFPETATATTTTTVAEETKIKENGGKRNQ